MDLQLWSVKPKISTSTKINFEFDIFLNIIIFVVIYAILILLFTAYDKLFPRDKSQGVPMVMAIEHSDFDGIIYFSCNFAFLVVILFVLPF